MGDAGPPSAAAAPLVGGVEPFEHRLVALQNGRDAAVAIAGRDAELFAAQRSRSRGERRRPEEGGHLLLRGRFGTTYSGQVSLNVIC